MFIILCLNPTKFKKLKPPNMRKRRRPALNRNISQAKSNQIKSKSFPQSVRYICYMQ
jgi:hypothetical protein